MAELWDLISPFIAAGLASWLTYRVGARTKRFEVLLDRKLSSFEALQARLNSIRRYCEAALSEFEGGEFAPRVVNLPVEDDRSALAHATALHYLMTEHRLFYSQVARDLLRDLLDKMSTLCSMELALQSSPELEATARSGYIPTVQAVDACLDQLYEELDLPDPARWKASG